MLSPLTTSPSHSLPFLSCHLPPCLPATYVYMYTIYHGVGGTGWGQDRMDGGGGEEKWSDKTGQTGRVEEQTWTKEDMA